MTLGCETLGFLNTPNDLSVKGKYLFYPLVFLKLQLLIQSLLACLPDGTVLLLHAIKNVLITSLKSSPGPYGSNDPAP